MRALRNMLADERVLTRVIAIELLAAGFLLNRDTVERMLVSSGATDGWMSRLVVLGVQFGCVAAGLALFARAHKRAASKWLLAGASAGLCALLNVVFLQLFYDPPVIGAGWRSMGVAVEMNQYGTRGRMIAYGRDDPVVLLVGDSQVEAAASPADEMPERQLEGHLHNLGSGAKVFSLGVSGYGQDQQLLLLEEYFQSHRADLVILWQTASNDIWNNMFPTHWLDNGHPKPTFWLENGRLRGPNYRFGELVDVSAVKVLMLWQRVLRKAHGGLDGEWESKLPPPYAALQNHEGPVNTTWEQLQATVMAQENLDTEKSHLAVYLTPPSPRMEYGVQLTRLLIGRMRALVESRGGKLVLLRTLTTLHLAGHEPEIYRFKGKLYRASAAQCEQTMQRVSEGFTAVQIPVTVENWRVATNDTHLNRQANDQVMRDLAKLVLPWLPRRGGELGREEAP